ncbi:MAG: hypothetical protein ACRCWP_15845 [Shewanella sp.]
MQGKVEDALFYINDAKVADMLAKYSQNDSSLLVVFTLAFYHISHSLFESNNDTSLPISRSRPYQREQFSTSKRQHG